MVEEFAEGLNFVTEMRVSTTLAFLKLDILVRRLDEVVRDEQWTAGDIKVLIGGEFG